MVQPEQPQPQRLPLFFRLRTARTANTRIHAKIKMSSTVPIFFPFSESGNHRRMQPAPSTGSRASGLRSGFAAVLTPRCFAPLLRPAPPCGALRASGLRSGFAAVLTPRCFAPLLRPAPPCGALRASGLRSGFAAVLTPRCFAPFVAARSTLRGVAGFGAAERLRRCPHPSVLRTLVAARSTLRGVAGFGAAERLRRCPHPSVLRTLVAARAIGISNHSVFHPCGALNLIAILQICRADLEISPVPAAGPAGTPAWPASTPAPSGRQ